MAHRILPSRRVTQVIHDYCWDWIYGEQHNPVGFLSFVWAVRSWLEGRPRIEKCARCGDGIWVQGRHDEDMFCSEQCAFYGRKVDDNALPF